MLSKNYKWHKIAESVLEVQNVMGNPCIVKVAGREICITVYKNEARACAAKCPHAGGLLHQGWLNPLGQLVCPLHRYVFDTKTGRNTSGEGYFLKTYPVMENDDGLFVGIEM